MAFFTPEMERLQDEYMETMKNRDVLRDMLVVRSEEHAVNGFSHDLEEFVKTVECAYSMVNELDLTNDETYELTTIQQVNRGIHYANTTLKSILAKYNEMQSAVCHQQLLDAKKEKALPNLRPPDYVVLRDLVVALQTEFDANDSVYLPTWKAIMLLKCLGYKGSSSQLINLIESRISRYDAHKGDNRRVPLLRLLHFININRARYDRHFECLQQAKQHCSVVDDAVRLSMAKKLLVQYVPDLPMAVADDMSRKHDYNKTSRLTFLQFALMVGPMISQVEQPDDDQIELNLDDLGDESGAKGSRGAADHADGEDADGELVSDEEEEEVGTAEAGTAEAGAKGGGPKRN